MKRGDKKKRKKKGLPTVVGGGGTMRLNFEGMITSTYVHQVMHAWPVCYGSKAVHMMYSENFGGGNRWKGMSLSHG
jgi:hypothetical protein